MSKINLMWPCVEVEVGSGHSTKVTLTANRRRQDGEAGAEVTIVIHEVAPYTFNCLMKAFADVENERLTDAERHHARIRDRLSAVWNLMKHRPDERSD